MVADRIRAAGYEVHHQVGCSGYRLDLAVVDPSAPGSYLLGVECDGATYHRAATARDRDKLRQMVLEDLGWKLHRIWSTDWWHDAKGQIEKLLAVVSELRAAREEAKHAKNLAEAGPASVAGIVTTVGNTTVSSQPPEIPPSAGVAGVYKFADFSDFHAIIYPDRFHDQGYDRTLEDLICHVIEQESPILEDLLVHRIARAHGFQKSGRLIRERVVALAEKNHHAELDPLGGRFFWPDSESPRKWNQYRIPASTDHFRKIEEIPLAELRAASLASRGTDLPVEIARLFGILRLSASSRERLDAMLKLTEGR